MFTALAVSPDVIKEGRTYLLAHILPKAVHKSTIKSLVDARMPFRRLFDLAITFYVPAMDDPATLIDVTQDLLFSTGVTASDAYRAASCNMWNSYDVTPLPDVLNFLDSHNRYMAMGTELYVATTRSRTNGAGLIASTPTLQSLGARFGRFYVLPTSIHELCIIPYRSDLDMNGLYRIISEINAAYTPLEDQLTDNVYLVDEDGNIESYV